MRLRVYAVEFILRSQDLFDIKEIDIMPKSIKIDFQLFIEISKKIYFWPKPFV